MLPELRNRPLTAASRFRALQSDLNELLASMWPGSRVGEDNTWFPPVSIKENDKHIVVIAELPGVDRQDLKIEVNRNTVTLKGEKRDEKEVKGESFFQRETSYGSFMRRVTLPAEVDGDHAEAKMDNGVLTVRIPKTAVNKAKTIKVS